MIENLEDLGAWVEFTRGVAEDTSILSAYEVRADVYQTRRQTQLDGRSRDSRTASAGGVGIRAFHGSGVGYAYCTELEPDALRDVVDRAARLAEANSRRSWKSFPNKVESARRVEYRPEVRSHPRQAQPEEIQRLLERAEAGAREIAPDAVVQTSWGSRDGVAVLANSAGGWVETQSLLTTLLVQTVMRDSGRMGDGAKWAGGERGLGDYEGDGGPEALGREAGRQAMESLGAKALPAGRYRTMYDPHLTGLLCHESFGHLTEFDVVAAGWSVLQGRLGQQLAPESITIRDAPVVDGGHRGVAVPFDHEGEAGREVTLLDRGVLTEYMHSRDSAASEGMAATGNARALNVRYAPIVRMRNTYVEPGDLSYEECLELLGDGVYLLGARGGAPRCDGSFMFTAQRGYVVEKGEIKHPVKMASIHGNVLDFFSGVEGLSREFGMHTNFFGGCGKWDQSFIHVGTGGPHVVAAQTLVGGQGA